MAAQIKVLIADDIAATRESLRKLLSFTEDIVIVAEASDGLEAIVRARDTHPDIILMDINMPGLDGIQATERLSDEMPEISIIMMSVQGDKEYLRRAMNAGAKDYLVKPFLGDELAQAIKDVYSREAKRREAVLITKKVKDTGKVIAIVSTKGGTGKTTISSNLAVAMSQQNGRSICLVDADLQFGDAMLFLNLKPRATVADLVKEDRDKLEPSLIAQYLTPYNDNLQVLAAPVRPEQAETISGGQLSDILKVLKTSFDYVLVDTAPIFDETMLGVLDAADEIIVVASLDLPSVKNVKMGLELMEALRYPQDKIRLVLNRCDSVGGISMQEVAESLRYPFLAAIPSDGRTVVSAVNRGVPFVVSNPDTAVAQSILKLRDLIAPRPGSDEPPDRNPERKEAPVEEKQQKRGFSFFSFGKSDKEKKESHVYDASAMLP